VIFQKHRDISEIARYFLNIARYIEKFDTFLTIRFDSIAFQLVRSFYRAMLRLGTLLGLTPTWAIWCNGNGVGSIRSTKNLQCIRNGTR